MNELQALVSDLVALEAGHPVVTLMLDTHWRDEQQRERVRLFFRDAAREALRRLPADSPDRTGLEASLEAAGRWVDSLVAREAWQEARGAAAFVSAPRDLFTEIVAPVVFPQQLVVDDRPRIGPLVETAASLPRALLVEVDSKGATVLEWRLGAVADEHEIRRETPRHHKMGGWSQRHYAQRIRARIKELWQEAADELVHIELAAPQPIVLFGQEPNLRGFKRLLPDWLEPRVLALLPAYDDRARRLQAAQDALDGHMDDREFTLVHRVVNQGQAGREGVLGLADTLSAMNERRLRYLVLSPRFQHTGFLCQKCRSLLVEGGSTCPFCAGPVRTVPLREELVRRCLTEAVELRLVTDGGPLDAFRGLGGVLRHVPGDEGARFEPAQPGTGLGP